VDLVRELEEVRAGVERGNNIDGPYFVDLLGRAVSAIADIVQKEKARADRAEMDLEKLARDWNDLREAAEALQRRLDAMAAPTEHESYRTALRQALAATQPTR